MFDDIFKNLQMHFPFLYTDDAHYKFCSDMELMITLKDGRRFLYDDIDKTVRKLPKDSNDMSEDECRSEFGKRLYKIMFRKGITQSELSEKTGLSQTMLSNYITGKNSPSFYNVDKIAKALECSIDDLRYL